MGIRIVSDNCCDLPAEILRKYDIRLAHLQVRFGDNVYPPGEPTVDEFYKILAESGVLPATSQPTVENITKVYTEALADGSEVIAIHMSSALSGTYQTGVMVQNTLNNPRLHVFDSLRASLGIGLMVVEAAKMAQRGESVAAIMERLTGMRKTIQCIFVVGNLDSLIRGGRLSKAKGKIAQVFDIKPILYMDDEGFLMPYDKARGLKGAQRKQIDIMEHIGRSLERQTVGINHSAVPEIAEALCQTIKERFAVEEVIVNQIGPIIGSHVGAGTFSVYFEK